MTCEAWDAYVIASEARHAYVIVQEACHAYVIASEACGAYVIASEAWHTRIRGFIASEAKHTQSLPAHQRVTAHTSTSTPTSHVIHINEFYSLI